MLRLTIPATEKWDEINNCFIVSKEHTLQLEHSLVSLSKWESKWCKPFYAREQKTVEETIDYIRCMTITQNVPPEAYECITNANIAEVSDYIERPMTATTFSKEKETKGSREIITAELIYYWMIALGIPMECQKWHLNRLITLIRVCNIKNTPPKKMSRKELNQRNRSLNAARRARLNSKG